MPRADPLLDALDAQDAAAFDHAARAVEGGPLRRLLEHVDEDTRAEGAPLLPPPGRLRTLEVQALVRLGPPGLWLATEWALTTIAGRERHAPCPPHEQWDALVEVHKARVEAPWMIAALFAALDAKQESLGRRVLIGIERRFGARGYDILRHAARDAPLAELIPG